VTTGEQFCDDTATEEATGSNNDDVPHGHASFGASVAKITTGGDQVPAAVVQAVNWNTRAINVTRALMSSPPMFRACPFLIITTASKPASARRAVRKLPKPRPGRVSRFTHRWSCSMV
jgi:hypothetical protein